MLTETAHLAIANTVFPVTDSYVEVVPGANHVRSWTDPDTYILCTAASDPAYNGSSMTRAQIESELVGRVLHVRNNQHGNAWYYANGHGGCYVDGPVLNPTPINGHHYRELFARNEENAPFILRYNDDAHSNDRRDPRHAWTIVDSPYQMTVGQGRVEDPSYWVEVNWPAAQVDIEEIFETEDAEEPQAAEEPPGTIINDVLTYTMGKAEAEPGSDVALLDPDRVVGEMYLTWHADSTSSRNITNVQQWADGNSGPGWVYVGHFTRAVDRDPVVRFTADLWGDGGDTDRSDFHWAKLALEQHVPDAEVEAERVARLEQQLADEHEAFEDLNDALNDLARTQSWCGEYERTMAHIQMRGRNQDRLELGDEIGTRHAYDVDVSVEFDGEIDYVRSGLESALEAAADFSGSVSSVRFTATANITVYGIVADSEDEARDQIDRELIDQNMGGIEYSEIIDWTIQDSREDEDFDWDSYDED